MILKKEEENFRVFVGTSRRKGLESMTPIGTAVFGSAPTKKLMQGNLTFATQVPIVASNEIDYLEILTEQQF